MFSYLIEILICQALFLGLYQFFKAEPFFRVNRIYLVGSLVISLILPLINFSQAIPNDISQAYVEWMQPLQIGGETIDNTTISKLENLENSSNFQWNTYAVIYGIGLFLYLLWFSLRNRTVFHYLSLNSFEDYKFKPLVIIPKSNMAFSFWNRIYLGSEIPESQRQVILEHEYQHLKQMHSWDMMFVEVLQFLMWFNPLIYIYKNQLRQIHEFEADQSVTRSHSKINYINTLLNQSFGSQNVSFVNTFFNSSNLKTRIKMLQKTQTSNLKKAKYFLILPVLFLAFLFSCTQDNVVERELSEEKMIREGKLFINRVFKVNPNVHEVIKQKPSLEELFSYYDLEIKEGYTELEKAKAGLLISIFTISIENKYDQSYLDEVLDEIHKNETLMIIYKQAVEAGKRGYREGWEAANFGNDSIVPFTSIDNPPHPESCSGLTDDELKKCMSDFIGKHVSDTFKLSDLDLDLKPGRKRISVQFKIDKNGKITNVRARGPSKELEQEAINAIQGLPQFIPGEQDGEKVSVLYGLPINFIIDK